MPASSGGACLTSWTLSVISSPEELRICRSREKAGGLAPTQDPTHLQQATPTLMLGVSEGIWFSSKSYWIKKAGPLLFHSLRAGASIALAGWDLTRGRGLGSKATNLILFHSLHSLL